MTTRFIKEIEMLKRELLSLAGMVEQQVHRAVESIERMDTEQAQSVIDWDEAIDNREVEVEEECLKVLALYQPVAIDLRFIVAVMKINNDLERVGDLAVTIAKRTLRLEPLKRVEIPFAFAHMAKKAMAMLKTSIDALVKMDPDMASEVCAADDEIDEINKNMYDRVKEGIKASPEDVAVFIHYLSVSRALERIGDYATNIAEDAIYLIKGRIIRHTNT